MEVSNQILILFFVLGLALGILIAGVYNIYEFNHANKELIDELSACSIKPPINQLNKNFNISVNWT